MKHKTKTRLILKSTYGAEDLGPGRIIWQYMVVVNGTVCAMTRLRWNALYWASQHALEGHRVSVSYDGVEIACTESSI